MIAFDIGANVGKKTAELLKDGYTTVISVEPVKTLFTAIHKKFFGDARVIAANFAVGNYVGAGKIKLCNVKDPLCACSSMSSEWIDAVTRSKRFDDGGQFWVAEQDVFVVTLDYLINYFGMPSYIKIDAEGSERKILEGLSQPVGMLSFEWTPELLGDAYACIDRCVELGMESFKIRFGEDGTLGPQVSNEGAKHQLRLCEGSSKAYGEVFCA